MRDRTLSLCKEMTAGEFWEIVGETHDPDMETNERNLLSRLSKLSGAESIDFHRFWAERYCELYTYPLWGVACLVLGICTNDDFMDWRNWVISCGRDAYQIARDSPDELIPVIEREPDAGMEGIGYIPQQDIESRGEECEEAFAAFDILEIHPDEPTGEKWRTHDELKLLLPKCYARYSERLW